MKKRSFSPLFLWIALALSLLIFLNFNPVLAQLICGQDTFLSCISGDFVYSRGGAVIGAALSDGGTAVYVPNGKVLFGPDNSDPQASDFKFRALHPSGAQFSVSDVGLIVAGVLTARGDVVIGSSLTSLPVSLLRINGELSIAKGGRNFRPVYKNLGEDTVQSSTFVQCSYQNGVFVSCNPPQAAMPPADTCDGNGQVQFGCPASFEGTCTDITSSAASCGMSGSCMLSYTLKETSCNKAVILSSD